ncbi:MAG TPA: hypothetical protein VGQ99_14765 [Tepidisphaeraceae bacterium]|nr:hypothetical protein [Tepidisphaeraceae bacterium]
MQKPVLVVVLLVLLSSAGFAFVKFCPLAIPKGVTITKLLSITSPDDLRTLRDAKLADLARLLEQITDADSARIHRPAAERAYLEVELITARSRMLPAGDQPAATPAADHPITQTRTQLLRLAKSEDITKELTPALSPLFREYRIAVSSNASPNILLITQLQTLRSQLDLYKSQHNDQYPDFRKYGWKQLTYRTNSAGQILDAAKFPGAAPFGPYLQTPPQNPLTRSSDILVVNAITTTLKPTKDYGFVFADGPGHLRAVGSDGLVFDESPASADIR